MALRSPGAAPAHGRIAPEMSDLPTHPSRQDANSDGARSVPGSIFTPPPSPARSLPIAVWLVAGLIVLAILGGLLLASHHHRDNPANTVLPLDPYAGNLVLTGVAMSESTSLSGGKSTFIDGHIHNIGSKIVTAATVQVFFRNNEGMPPAIETLPISLVRTREPYVDTQPISANPLKPGDDREFRLIFETIPGNWNV